MTSDLMTVPILPMTVDWAQTECCKENSSTKFNLVTSPKSSGN